MLRAGNGGGCTEGESSNTIIQENTFILHEFIQATVSLMNRRVVVYLSCGGSFMGAGVYFTSVNTVTTVQSEVQHQGFWVEQQGVGGGALRYLSSQSNVKASIFVCEMCKESLGCKLTTRLLQKQKGPLQHSTLTHLSVHLFNEDIKHCGNCNLFSFM